MFKMIVNLFKRMFRIVHNEADSILKKMEDMEKSLCNALSEYRERYKKYKGNCAQIFSLESELTKDLEVQEKLIAGINTSLITQKEMYQKNNDENIKSGIMYFLSKLQHHENIKKSIQEHLNQQIEQNKNVTINLRNSEQKISELSQKVEYVRTQIKIAKNKEMMMDLNDGTGVVYDINEVFRDIEKYISDVDGRERVEEIVGTNQVIEIQVDELIKKTDLNEKFLEFMNGNDSTDTKTGTSSTTRTTAEA